MLYQQFELTVAHYPTLDSVIKAELSNADIVQIDQHIFEGIYHSDQLNWKGDLTFFEKPEDFVRSEKERKKLSQSRDFFLAQGYTLEVKEVDEAASQAFAQLYNRTTLKKNRAIDYDAELLVKRNVRSGTPVYLFGLYKGPELLSGLLVTKVKEDMRVMFGAKLKFDEVRGGIGGVLEMELLRFCFERGLKRISHGISTNPAGFVDNAGIFEFKSRYGFTAFPYGEWRTTFVLNPKVAISDLVFLTIVDNGLCYQVLSLEPKSDIAKYRTRLVTNVQQQTLAHHIEHSRSFFRLPS